MKAGFGLKGQNFSQQIDRLKEALENADAVVIGVGAGLSTSAGLTYSAGRNGGGEIYVEYC